MGNLKWPGGRNFSHTSSPCPQTFEISSLSISIIRKDILSSVCNWDDLRRRANLAFPSNDSESASWLISEWQMLIKCTLGHHPPLHMYDKHMRTASKEHRSPHCSWQVALLTLHSHYSFSFSIMCFFFAVSLHFLFFKRPICHICENESLVSDLLR